MWLSRPTPFHSSGIAVLSRMSVRARAEHRRRFHCAIRGRGMRKVGAMNRFTLLGICLLAGSPSVGSTQMVDSDGPRARGVPAGVFHGAGVLVAPPDLGQVGSIADLVGATVIELRSKPQIQPYDQVYLTLTGSLSVGDRVQFMRADRVVAPYGRIYLVTGGGSVLRVDEGVAIVEVDSFYDRVEIGNLVVRRAEYSVPSGVSPVPATGLAGSVLALQLPQPIPATQDLVFLNLGEASGVQVGDEFEVYLAPEVASWGMRPEIVVGRLQVVRTARLTSAARVVALEQPALRPGLPARLIAKMP